MFFLFPQRRHAFTLVELLVVLGIIAILAAILMPIYNAAQARGKAAQCASNLRKIGVGLHLYLSDNDGRFPDGLADVSWYGGISTSRCWYDAAAEYMGREYVIYHKGDPLPAEFGCPAGHGKAYEPAWPYTGDYGYNSRLGRVTDGVMKLAAVKNPAATPFVQDIVKQNGFGEWIFNAGYDKKSGSAFAARHNGSGNILWVDGHVSSFKYADYMDYANNPSHRGAYNFVRGDW
jgi:prepilin-type processing-associated H-X9-DG protein/prepilin-type N-terminal cleavage/methylation domain-containing protein